MNEPVITTLEDVCHCFGQPLSSTTLEIVQAKIERLLQYLEDNYVIECYDEDKLDRLFSHERTY